MKNHGIILAYLIIALFIANIVYLHTIWHAELAPGFVSNQDIEDLFSK